MFTITPFTRRPVTLLLNSQRPTARRGRRWPILATLVAMLAAGAMLAPLRLAAQDNVLDLRFLELNSKGDVTYQNFIYAHNFDGGKWMAQAFYLRESSIDYGEFGVGAGYRVAAAGGFSGYAIAGAATSTAAGVHANYFEPAFLITGAQGKWSGSFFLQRYVAVDSRGVNGWLIDPVEFSYNFAGPFAIGASVYGYQPNGIDWQTKLGIKFGINDKLGTSELRVSAVNTPGGLSANGLSTSTTEFQFRRIFVF
jgi:hypothetical protein